MIINPYSIGPSISGLGVFTLGVYVLSKDIKNPLNRAFFFSVFSLTIWLSFYGVIYNAPHFANTYSRIAYCGITFIPITFFDFVSLWTQLSWTKYWRIF
ncbi:MAG: hypothetical protein JNN05_09705, partial [Candidatus Omnitrophica bacterium]|nr:hypothetical protein [Candidatus Omnitrophota bacterium]